MKPFLARMLLVAALASLVPLLGQSPPHAASSPLSARLDASQRTVFLAGQLSEEELIAFSSNLAASGHPGTLLLDAPGYVEYTRHFLAGFQPQAIVPIGGISRDLERRLDVPIQPAVAWGSAELWERLFPKAPAAVLCPAQPRRLLLQAAVLAGALRAPLWICRDETGQAELLRRRLTQWQTTTIYAVGAVQLHVPEQTRVRIVTLSDETAVSRWYRRLWGKQERTTLVAANPADTRLGHGSMSLLAPWLAIQRHAPLLLTNDDGTDLAERLDVDAAASQLDCLLLAADLQAIPMERRPNPVPGKDEFIEMEPLTPTAPAPFSYSTGRLFHAHPGVVTLMLARQRLLAEQARQRPDKPWKALVVSNPGGGLPLLETFSRVTAFELENCGFRTTSRCGTGLAGEELRQLLPEHDIFLWEGHHSTLIRDYGLPEWTEPLPPSFVFLQSCLALTDTKAHPLLERGAIGVVGSSTRIYSATGGAFSLAYFNALLYDQQTLGGALRQAKNFLLAYALLKEKRLGGGAKLSGANLRSAWAFTLWGDPTFELPRPQTPRRPPVRCTVKGSMVTLHLPDQTHDRAAAGRYEAQLPPNGRLAGLVSTSLDGETKPLVPLLFAEVPLPELPSGVMPRLHAPISEKNWVFIWDARRKVGTLLVAQPTTDRRELRFHLETEPPGVVQQSLPDGP